jgi:hypothetical protein
LFPPAPLPYDVKVSEKYLGGDINRLKESLSHKDKVFLEQAGEIAELKQKLLQVEESYQKKREFARKKSDIAEADLLVSVFCNIKLSCKMNAKSVMSFGLKMVGFGAKRQNLQDTLNMQRFRSPFGIGP